MPRVPSLPSSVRALKVFCLSPTVADHVLFNKTAGFYFDLGESKRMLESITFKAFKRNSSFFFQPQVMDISHDDALTFLRTSSK